MKPRAGLEPATCGLQENQDQVSLEDYHKYLEVELQLSKRTIYQRVRIAKEFIKHVGNPYLVTREQVRDYLLEIKRTKTISTYRNYLASLRHLFKYIGREYVIDGFRYPTRSYVPKRCPTKDELRTFYEALDDMKERALFLVACSSGLRRKELLSLTLDDIDLETGLIIPKPNHGSKTKHTFLTFCNNEALEVLKQYLKTRSYKGKKLFPYSKGTDSYIFHKAQRKTGLRITLKVCRLWFNVEMAKKGVPSHYIDAFCGRVPQGVIARHYADYNIEVMEQVYRKANLKVLD